METKCYSARGQYGREIEVKKSEGTCFECRYNKIILIFDNSAKEYSPIKFCRECLIDFLDGKISESSWLNKVKDL